MQWRVEKMRFRQNKTAIKYNDFLTLEGIPEKAHRYRLGIRSALEWLADQYQVRHYGRALSTIQTIRTTSGTSFGSLGDTHHAPPEKALAYLSTGTLEDEDGGRMPIHEPLGVLGWLDRSGPPWSETTTGFLRSTLGTFVDGGFRVFLVTKENIELGKIAGGASTSHAVVIGRLADHTSTA